MSDDFENTKLVLMDLLMEHGDEEAVEALRNLDRLKKVQKHLAVVSDWVRGESSPEYDDGYCRECDSPYGGHDRDCSIGFVQRDVLGPEEVERQFNAAWDLAIAEKARRERPPRPPTARVELQMADEILRRMYPPNEIAAMVDARLTGLAAWLPEPSPDNFYGIDRSVAPPSPDNLFGISAHDLSFNRPLAPPRPVISVIADKNVPDGIAYMLPSQRASAVMDLFKTPMTAAAKLNAAETLLRTGVITRDDFTKILNADPTYITAVDRELRTITLGKDPKK